VAVKPIVAAIDGSAEALRAVGWAVREAVLRDAPLRIVSAAALPPRMSPRKDAQGPSTVAEIVTAERDRALTAAAERATAIDPDLLVSTDDLTGPVAEAVADSGAGASMLVVGSRGAGAFAAMILGSVSRYAATHAPSPVVVVRDDAASVQQGLIVVGVRNPDDCDAALTFAFEEAALHNAGLLAVHAWQADHRGLLPNEDPAPGSEDRAGGRRQAARDAASRLAGEVPHCRRQPGSRARPPGPGAGRPVLPRRPGRARQAPSSPGGRPGCPRRPEPRSLPGRDRPHGPARAGGLSGLPAPARGSTVRRKPADHHVKLTSRAATVSAVRPGAEV